MRRQNDLRVDAHVGANIPSRIEVGGYGVEQTIAPIVSGVDPDMAGSAGRALQLWTQGLPASDLSN